jgi:hyperosmotically inducible protein
MELLDRFFAIENSSYWRKAWLIVESIFDECKKHGGYKMKAMTVIYSCFIAASVAIAADSGKMHRQHEVNSSMNSPTQISDMNGAPDSVVRHARTAGRSEDPNTGMASPDNAQPIVDMRDSRYDKTFGVRQNYQQRQVVDEDLQPSTATGATDAAATEKKEETTTTTTTTESKDTKDTKDAKKADKKAKKHMKDKKGAYIDSHDESSDVAADEDHDMSATGTTAAHKAKHKAHKAKAKAKDATKDESDKAKDETKNSTKMDADQGKVADQQANSSETDTEITRQVRREVMNDEKLSTRAQNITIVTQDGKVALRGSVPSAEEKTKLESMARKIAGVKSVDASQVMISQ